MFILYKITHAPTNSIYYGIIIKEGKLLIERFIEHLRGAGSVEIRRLLLDGADQSDFFIEQLKECSHLDDIQQSEVEAIREGKQRGEKLLNRNGGGGFIGKKFFYNSSYYNRGWDVNIYLTKTKNTPIQDLIENNCTNIISYRKISIKRKNSFRFVKYISFILKNSELIYKIGKYNCVRIYQTLSKFNANTVDSCFSSYQNTLKLFEYLRSVNGKDEILQFDYACEQYFNFAKHIISNGRQNEDLFFINFFEQKHAKLLPNFRLMYGSDINSPSDTEGWKLGRDSYRTRVSAGVKTEKEIIAIAERSKIIADGWTFLSETEIKNRTMHGLSTMNSREYVCDVCNKPGLTKGNLNRWHNQNCKEI